MKYAIRANYYHYFESNPPKEAKKIINELVTEEDKTYNLPLYLGLEGKLKIFIFEKEITKKTKLFKTAKEAGEYLDKHFNSDEKQYASFESLEIVQIKGE